MVLKDFLTIYKKEKLGSGTFCEVKKASISYKANKNIPEDLVLPYAVKIYENYRLKG